MLQIPPSSVETLKPPFKYHDAFLVWEIEAHKLNTIDELDQANGFTSIDFLNVFLKSLIIQLFPNQLKVLPLSRQEHFLFMITDVHRNFFLRDSAQVLVLEQRVVKSILNITIENPVFLSQFLLVHEMNHFVKGIFLLQIIFRIFNGFTLQWRHNVFHQVELGFLQLVSEDQVAVLLGIHTHIDLVYLRVFVFRFIFIFNLILVKQRYFQLLWFLKSKCLILRSWFLRKSVRDFEIYFLIRIIVYLDLDGCFLIGTNHTRYLVRCWSQHQNVLIFAWVQVSMFHERRSD